MTEKTADIERIREQVEERRRIAREQLEAKKPPADEQQGGIKSDLVIDCLYANASGDGILFAELFRDKYLFHNLAQEWMVWDGHHWAWDICNQALKSVEAVAQVYLEEARRLVDQIDWATRKGDKDQVRRLQDRQADIYKRVARLRSENGRQNCLKFARSNSVNSLDTAGDKFDMDPWLLVCTNGVLDLRTGELRDGRPEDQNSRCCNSEWTGIDTKSPALERFMKETLRYDDLIDFSQRLFGYGITGLTTEHVVPVLWGENGRNGKGTLVETIMHVLGDYAGPIESEMLLDSGRAKSSAGPSPDIMDLKGVRLAFASETDENRKFSTARVKWLSGGDTLKGRWPHEKRPVSFRPSHLLVLMTNNKPHAPAEDAAFWERLKLIPFEISFVRDRDPQGDFERPADINLKEKLLAESSGIVAWLVRGCLAWQQHGLQPPSIVMDATAEYRRDEDILSDFIDDQCLLDKNAECPASDLYARFQEWWEQNISKKRIPSQKKFGKWMSKKFKKEKHGKYKYFGLDLMDHGADLFGR